GDDELLTIYTARLTRRGFHALDRRRVVVEADERRARERFRHDERRGTVAAADVGDVRTRLELRLRAVERRDPLAHEVRLVRRPEEALRAAEERRVVLVPPDAGTAAKRLEDLRHDARCS